MSELTYQRWVIAYIFDVDGLTAFEAFGCVAAGAAQAINITSVQLGLALARETYVESTLAQIASPDPLPERDYRLREIRPYCFGAEP